MITFLCGCKAQKVIARENLKTMDAVALDAEGFLTCKLHNARRAGWRSVPYTATTRPMSGTGSWTPLEYECFVLYGEIPATYPIVIEYGSVPDRRDNRDPEEVALKMLHPLRRRIQDIPQA